MRRLAAQERFGELLNGCLAHQIAAAVAASHREFGHRLPGELAALAGAAPLAEQVDHVADESFGLLGFQPGGHGFDAIKVASELLDPEALSIDPIKMAAQCFGGQRLQLDGVWDE